MRLGLGVCAMNESKIETIGKGAAETAIKSFKDAESLWKTVLDADQDLLDITRQIWAIRALGLEMTACFSVLCSTLAKLTLAALEDENT